MCYQLKLKKAGPAEATASLPASVSFSVREGQIGPCLPPAMHLTATLQAATPRLQKESKEINPLPSTSPARLLPAASRLQDLYHDGKSHKPSFPSPLDHVLSLSLCVLLSPCLSVVSIAETKNSLGITAMPLTNSNCIQSLSQLKHISASFGLHPIPVLHIHSNFKLTDIPSWFKTILQSKNFIYNPA